MILGFMSGVGPVPQIPELCLIPDKPDSLSHPVMVDRLETTDCAVFRISPTEAFTAAKLDNEDGVHIVPVTPTPLYITPNLNDRPGVKVAELKIVRVGERRYRTYFLPIIGSDGSWKEWLPRKAL